jgi:hypothetical protein
MPPTDITTKAASSPTMNMFTRSAKEFAGARIRMCGGEFEEGSALKYFKRRIKAGHPDYRKIGGRYLMREGAFREMFGEFAGV